MLNDKDLFNKINSGFSLIELVIVIAVLAILSAIGVPAFLGIREKAADTLVKVSMINSWKECQVDTLDLDSTNGFYEFYQQYDYIEREDGSIPPTIIGNCIGPLGAHRIGVIKIKGNNAGGELWLNLSTGEKIQNGGLTWD